MIARSLAAAHVSRRRLIGTSLAGAVLVPLGTTHHASANLAAGSLPAALGAQPAAASPVDWRMWLLDASDDLRPAAPGAPTQAEIDEVLKIQADSTDETVAAIARWGRGHAVFPWITLAGELFTEFMVGGMPQGRFLAVLTTALHDATIAAWDARLAHERPGPVATDAGITAAAGVDPELASFPSEHAAVAGAAAMVLAYLLPDAAAGRFDDLATAAAESRIAAGAAFRSDIDAGLAIGRAVGERALTRAKADGSDAKWDASTRPTGPGTWQPTPPGFVETPAAPLAGSWTPWVLSANDQFRPPPPPEYGSAAWTMELEDVQEVVANLTFEQERAALWWGTSSPVMLFAGWTRELIQHDGVDAPHTARILADINVAVADALITVWDAKYVWWTSRPVTEDPELRTVIPTPPYPSYPSGYSAVVGSASTVVGHYFPEAADDMANRAWEAACSRCWAGIHYAIDDDVGLMMGRQVGRLVSSIDRASATG